MGLLSRVAQQAASRLGAEEVAIPIRAGGRPVVVGFRRTAEGTEVVWGWGNSPKGSGHYARPENLTRKDTRAAFDDVTRFIADEMAGRTPQRYLFDGLTAGHGRRYARDIERLGKGSGYVSGYSPYGNVILDPTWRAYLNYATPGIGLAAGGAGLATLEANARY